MAQAAAAKVFVCSEDADVMRNVREILKANSTVTCYYGVTSNMDVVAEFDPPRESK